MLTLCSRYSFDGSCKLLLPKTSFDLDVDEGPIKDVEDEESAREEEPCSSEVETKYQIKY